MSCCKTSFTLCDPLPACINVLEIKTSIISDDATIKIVDKFDKVYSVTKTTDGNGIMTINLVPPDENTSEDLPIGLLNEYAGFFKVFLFNSTGTEVKWIISAVEYDALVFHLVNETPASTTYQIDPTYLQGTDGTF